MSKRVSDTLSPRSSVQPAEHDGSNGKQGESRQDAGHEGEAQANGNRASTRLGAAPRVGSHFGREPGERGGRGRTQTRAGAERLRQRPKRGNGSSEVS